MIIYGVDSANQRYRLSLSKTRLAQRELTLPRFFPERFYVKLRDFYRNTSLGYPCAPLRTKSDPDGEKYAMALLDALNRRIGCTTFNKTTWVKIERAIKALRGKRKL